jgi:dephospho-CoA kinase
MLIVGLTGSIGMGKSTAGAMLRGMGIPVYDADAVVHGLLARGGAAVAPVEAAFPGTVGNGAVDRQALGRTVFGDAAALGRLEAITHPLVRRAQRAFLRRAALGRAAMVILDIPLLFETGGDRSCDATILLTAPQFLQRQRVLSRPGMTPEKLAGIQARQMPEAEKRRRAGFIVMTGLDKGQTLRALRRIVTLLAGRPGRHWPPRRPRQPGRPVQPGQPGRAHA